MLEHDNKLLLLLMLTNFRFIIAIINVTDLLIKNKKKFACVMVSVRHSAASLFISDLITFTMFQSDRRDTTVFLFCFEYKSGCHSFLLLRLSSWRLRDIVNLDQRDPTNNVLNTLYV